MRCVVRRLLFRFVWSRPLLWRVWFWSGRRLGLSFCARRSPLAPPSRLAWLVGCGLVWLLRLAVWLSVLAALVACLAG